jgi:plastocyanin
MGVWAAVLGLLSSPSATAAEAPELPAKGSLFGAYVGIPAGSGLDRRTVWTQFEQDVGRRMAVDRVFYSWDAVWPTADDAWSRDQGRMLYLSWGIRRLDRSIVQWADIASGAYDAVIDARAADLIAFDAPVIFSFTPEPENDPAGTPADFIAAFRHIRDRFETAGVANVRYAWTMMAWSFRTGNAANFYPGDDAVDIIAADGYNWYACERPTGPWRSFTDIFKDFHKFGTAHSKPMFVAEWGSNEDPAVPGRKATWIAEAATQIAAWPGIKGAVYFNTDAGCPRWVTSSPSALASFSAMAADPYFNPPPEITIDKGPTLTTTSHLASFTFTSASAAGFRCSLDGAPPTTCGSAGQGSRSYSTVPTGHHVFSVWGVDALGEPTTGTTRWAWSIAEGAPINVVDFTYKPATRFTKPGSQLLFAFAGPSTHSVTDTSGLGLFDSGPQTPGSRFAVDVTAAGTYTYACTITPTMKGTIKAGVTATPSSGGVATTYEIRWASDAAAPGFAYDVQIKRPNTTVWKMFRNDVAESTATFQPDAGAGTYRFRARLQRTTDGKASQYSGALALTVA